MTAFIISALSIAWIIVIYVNSRPTQDEIEEKEYQAYKKMLDDYEDKLSKEERFHERYLKERGK